MRIYHLRRATAPSGWGAVCNHAKGLGFDHLLVSLPVQEWEQACSPLAQECERAGLILLTDLDLPDGMAEGPDAWAEPLVASLRAGVAGFRVLQPSRFGGNAWAAMIARVHEHHPDAMFLAWTPGLTRHQLRDLPESGFDYVFSSLPWWDFRSDWLVEERARLREVAPVIAPVYMPDGQAQQEDRQRARRWLWTAAFLGDGFLVQEGLEDLAGGEVMQEVNRWASRDDAGTARIRGLTGPLSPTTALARLDAKPSVLLVNPRDDVDAPIDVLQLSARLPGSYALTEEAAGSVPGGLAPGGWMLLPLEEAKPVLMPTGVKAWRRKGVTEAMASPRIAIERITPLVDDGMFAVKRTVGEPVEVQADVFMDGHAKLSATLLWRAADEPNWRRVPMKLLDNHRWSATFHPRRLGMHCYAIQAWRDDWLSYRDGLAKRVAAGQDVALDVEEGRMLIGRYRDRIQDELPEMANTLASMVRKIGNPRSTTAPVPKKKSLLTGAAPETGARDLPAAQDEHIDLLLSELWSSIMHEVPVRPFETTTPNYPLMVERREAGYASWYELFPRSQAPEPDRHGTFQDVIARLPYIRMMGFDVLYMPPIHPIGLANRKGRNNSLRAEPGDPGSPYAIGSEEGGHDAVHPELGTIEDFQELVSAAQAQHLEVALDFAIQCSPDHPWLKAHPEWFDWRPDGTLRYAENPPKRYEDIVNPEFYASSDVAPGKAGLWKALRDVILFWASQGVRIFRVDNPHTKPLPFWQWLIAEVQGAHPDVVFLSEAFTHPKLMYRLGKLGFSQSYTYFTWRHGKQELTDYLLEVSRPPVSDYFRPHFFVNTPDINPYFLQESGRAGFLIRAALAATTSGLWGMYSGFELCEARPIPGKEEYLDSEKYQLRHWDWDRPGNIVQAIARLNHIRRINPALQMQQGLTFHSVDNEKMLFFTRSTPDLDNVVLVAISLDPHARQAGRLELPLDAWGLNGRPVPLHDQMSDQYFTAYDPWRHVELSPEQPFLIWRLSSAEA